MAESLERDTHPVDAMVAVADVLTNRRLARVYVRVLEGNEPTVNEIVAGLDSSSTTVYEDVNRLTEAGLLERTADVQPRRYRPAWVSITVGADSGVYEITPTLIVALARSTDNRNLDVYIDRHGLSGLARAMQYAREYIDGKTTSRVMARELDQTVLEAETVLQELREIVLEFEPEARDPLDIEELDARVGVATDDTEPIADVE